MRHLDLWLSNGLRHFLDSEVKVKLLAKFLAISLQSISCKISARLLRGHEVNFHGLIADNRSEEMRFDIVTENTREFNVFGPLVTATHHEVDFLHELSLGGDLDVGVPA